MNDNNIIKVLLETNSGVRYLTSSGMIKILVNIPDDETDNIIKCIQETHRTLDEIFYTLFLTGSVSRYEELYEKYEETLIVAYALKVDDATITTEEVLEFLGEIDFSSPISAEPTEICWDMALFGTPRNFMDLWRRQVKETGSRIYGPVERTWMQDTYYELNN